MAALRRLLGALLFEGPQFFHGMRRGAFAWVGIRNRADLIVPGVLPPGVTPAWNETSGLHFCSVFPGAGTRLLRRCCEDVPFGFRPCLEDKEPVVSFLIGHRGMERVGNLQRVLESIAAQLACPVECVVCEQDDSPKIPGLLPPWVKHVFDPVPGGSPYNRSRAFNQAARQARGRYFILHDNDLLVPACYAAAHAAALSAGWEAANLKRFIFYMAKGSHYPGPDVRVGRVLQNARGGGSLAIRADAFRAIGGMDEGFVGWGGEDVEFWDRCLTLRLCDSQYLPLIHLWHPDQTGKRAVGGKGLQTATYFQTVMRSPAATRIARLQASSERTSS